MEAAKVIFFRHPKTVFVLSLQSGSIKKIALLKKRTID
jgi:hypothetical protein